MDETDRTTWSDPHRAGRPLAPRSVRPLTEWDGYVAIVATDSGLAPEFYCRLREAVRHSAGGVLVRMQEPSGWPGAPVIGVQLMRRRDGAAGPTLWIGPLDQEQEQESLLRWLTAGGPAGSALPPALLRHTRSPG
ncbi:MAG: hypothetical protein EKK42_31630 [Pseudonocardiaceae bacterium]|nr:MAG: hypothetical protein EKK42_31630 [Pseudonocardiaceae bacterium]